MVTYGLVRVNGSGFDLLHRFDVCVKGGDTLGVGGCEL